PRSFARERPATPTRLDQIVIDCERATTRQCRQSRDHGSAVTLKVGCFLDGDLIAKFRCRQISYSTPTHYARFECAAADCDATVAAGCESPSFFIVSTSMEAGWGCGRGRE